MQSRERGAVAGTRWLQPLGYPGDCAHMAVAVARPDSLRAVYVASSFSGDLQWTWLPKDARLYSYPS